MKLKTRRPKAVRVSLEVQPCHIEEMEYWLNECPMSDVTRRNALASALRSLVRTEVEVRVFLRGDGAVAELNGETIHLGAGLSAWLKAALTGLPVQPVATSFRMPVQYLESGSE